MEYRPLLNEVPTQLSTKDTSSRKKTTILGVIAVIGIIATFVAYNNGFGKKEHITSHIMTSHERNEKLRINLESIDFKPDLKPYEGQSIELVEDPGNVEMETFTNSLIKGTFDMVDGTQTLTFVFDANSKYVFLELTDSETHDVINSFYSAKTVDANTYDLYTIDGNELDIENSEATYKSFIDFYQTPLPTAAIQLSIKVASLGYTGPMATSIKMVHALAVHWVEMPNVKENLPDSWDTNRQALNSWFENENRRLLEAESLEKQEISANPRYGNKDGSIVGDWCLFWCDSSDDCPGATDGCPSYCYEVGGCGEEDKCDNECFGRCGDGCDCWSWVCGDCDCHCLCENHDYFCSCESTWEYECWSLWNWYDDDCD